MKHILHINQIVRVGRTFAITENGYEGLLKNKKSLSITARGGSYSADSPMAQLDFQAPYLRKIFNFIGLVSQISVLSMQITLAWEMMLASSL